MTQSVLESMARAIYESHGFKKPWDHPDTQRGWKPVLIREARAALIALRDGVTADQATIEATLSDTEYGYGSFLEPFQAALNHVLQEGEKGKDNG